MIDDKTGVLLLSHGSRLDEGEEVIKAYKEMFVEEYPDAVVEYGFMEIRQPTIPQTIKKLTDGRNLEKIVVVPVFIAHGLHTKRDIPHILGLESDIEESHHHHHHHHHHHDHEEEEVDFEGEIILTDPIGVDRRMYEIIKERIQENL